jgi:hypothetical protein
MFNQAATVALRILLFRAGPQDFPHAAAISRLIVPLTAVVWCLQYGLSLPPAAAAIHAAASLGALAGFTYLLLQARGLTNRARQTIDSLFLTDAALTLLLLPPLSVLAPHMIRIAENPELARTEPLPALPAIAVMVVSLWNFMVSAHIYRHALNTHLGMGSLVALLAAIVTVSVASAVGALLA